MKWPAIVMTTMSLLCGIAANAQQHSAAKPKPTPEIYAALLNYDNAAPEKVMFPKGDAR
jgi:hypothetical protein